MGKKIIGIVGSYRKDRTIDSAVSTVLRGAQDHGAQTKKIYLIDKHIKFCRNCRKCTEEKANRKRGSCVHHDDMEQILTEIDDADGIVLGSPINVSTVTAVMKKFIERLIVYAYRPWALKAPKFRTKQLNKKAVIVTSSAAPAFIGRILMPNALAVMKVAAKCMGAKVVKSLYIGTACQKEHQKLTESTVLAAHKAGEKLASGMGSVV